MPEYLWNAINADGVKQNGLLEASDKLALGLELEKSGLILVKARVRSPVLKFGSQKITKIDLVNFSFQISMMLKAGVPLLDALRDIAAVENNQAMRKVIRNVSERISAGQPFSASLAQHPKVFDEIYVGLVHAGEHTGQLTQVLEQLTETLKWQHEMSSQTKKALIYPVIVLVVISGVLLFLLGHVVPQITSLLKSMRVPLPWQTKVLMAISDFVSGHLILLGVGFVASFLLLVFLAKLPGPMKTVMDGFKLKLPVLGPVLRQIALARFAYVFALLYAAGVSVMDSLAIVEAAVGNKVVAQAISQAKNSISAGRSLSQAFTGVSIIPPLVVSMLRVGEATGGLDIALGNVGYLYTRQAREAVENLQATLQPILTVVLGVILSLVMMFSLGPLYDTVLANAKF